MTRAAVGAGDRGYLGESGQPARDGRGVRRLLVLLVACGPGPEARCYRRGGAVERHGYCDKAKRCEVRCVLPVRMGEVAPTAHRRPGKPSLPPRARRWDLNAGAVSSVGRVAWRSRMASGVPR